LKEQQKAYSKEHRCVNTTKNRYRLASAIKYNGTVSIRPFRLEFGVSMARAERLRYLQKFGFVDALAVLELRKQSPTI
jgi:hypothetical protein